MADGQAADALLALGRHVLSQQAFSRLLGAELTAWDARCCTLELPLRAEPVASGKAQAVCRCEVVALADGAEKLCAVAQGTIVRLAEASS